LDAILLQLAPTEGIDWKESNDLYLEGKLAHCVVPDKSLTSIVVSFYKRMMRLAGKVAVITGASMGIGEAIAKLFVEEGARVVMSSRDEGRTEAARLRIGRTSQTLAIICDVRNREDLDRLLSLTLHNFGRVDIWVNNAGYGLSDSVDQMDMNACRAMFDTNLFGAISGMQVVTPVFVKQGSGTIINISSVAGHIPVPYKAAYSATKFALNAIGKAARIELQNTGVNVLTVCPGYIATNFSRNVVRGNVRKRLGSAVRKGPTPDVVAHATLDGYLKGKREVVVPGRDGWIVKLYQIWPGLIERAMRRMVQDGDEIVAE
jgi:short-subunit dehydrogenase